MGGKVTLTSKEVQLIADMGILKPGCSAKRYLEG